MPALLSPKAIKWCGVLIASGHHHAQHLAIAKEVGEGRAYTNFGIASHSLMDYSKAIEHHAQHLAIAKEVVDRAGEGGE